MDSNFDEILQTTQSVECLKKTISQLAVMGRLTQRGKSAQNANILLELVSKKRTGMIAAKAIRKDKPPSLVEPDTVPFGVPSGWQWARIGQIALFTQYGTSIKAPVTEKGVPVLAMGNIQDGSVTTWASKRLPESCEEFPELLLKKNDILYNRTNSAELVGKTGIFKGEDGSATFASYLIRIRVPDNLISPDYVNLVMNTPFFRKTQVEPHIQQQTGQANVNGTIMRNMLIPVPPFEEQLRIFEKVEELHFICDQIGAKLARIDELKVALANQITISLAA